VRTNGELKNVGRSGGYPHAGGGLQGVICTATISPHLPEDTLILLRHILLQKYGEPMAALEDLDIDLQGVFLVIK
jgi:hypothetical protein